MSSLGRHTAEPHSTFTGCQVRGPHLVHPALRSVVSQISLPATQLSTQRVPDTCARPRAARPPSLATSPLSERPWFCQAVPRCTGAAVNHMTHGQRQACTLDSISVHDHIRFRSALRNTATRSSVFRERSAPTWEPSPGSSPIALAAHLQAQPELLFPYALFTDTTLPLFSTLARGRLVSP